MKPGIFYISRTGNTKNLAEALSDQLNAPVFNIANNLEPSVADDFDLLVIGTPVMGLKPAPEVLNFVKRLPEGHGKKIILFCTYAIRQGGALKVLAKELNNRGYQLISSVSKKGFKMRKSDFADILKLVAEVTDK
jgi:flavodoxin